MIERLIVFAYAVIFILRLYSIYSKSSFVLYSFSALLVIELAIKIVSKSSHLLLWWTLLTLFSKR